MCVTNTTYRRQQAISLSPQPQQQYVGGVASVGAVSELTQRLMGTIPLQSGGDVTISTCAVAKTDYSAAFAATTASAASCDNVFGITSPAITKPRPKRRRKPQKPGKTAKMNDRHFVVHNYHDHSHDTEEQVEADVAAMVATQEETTEDEQHATGGRRKGGVAVAFPLKLHAILDQVERDGLGHVISWQPHGRCFVIHQPKVFTESVMPKYFRQTKLTSFQRQLNLYGFCRLTRGNDAGGYYHELFLRGMPFLTKKMIRTKVKGTKFKAASSPDQEPDFYNMPPVIVTPHGSPHHSHNNNDYGNLEQDAISEAPLAAAAPQPTPLSDVFSMFQQHAPPQIHNNVESSMDPFPFSFLPQVQSSTTSAATQFLLQNPFGDFSAAPVQQIQHQLQQHDPFLDEAVDELFMENPTEDLNDFVHDWTDSNAVQVHRSLENDAQLGYMLDRLLGD